VRRRTAPFAAKRLKRILHATDFSTASRPAFRMAVGLAQREAARLLLLHVLPPPSPLSSGRRPPSSYLELLALARRDARRRLARSLTQARGAGARVQEKLVEGGAVEGILGVAEQVVRRASRPVLTVRGR
jgi:nucleotide-binding universal stress UspA family protein